MFGKQFVLNGQTLPIIQELGRHISDGFFICRADSEGKLLYTNDALPAIYGCGDPEEFMALTHRTLRGMVFSEDVDKVSRSLLLQSGEQEQDHVDYRIIRKDGEIRRLYERGRFILTDPDGRLYTGLICSPQRVDCLTPRQRSPRDSESPVAEGPSLSQMNALRLSGHRVLLAEDQPVNAEIAAEVLAAAGLEVDWAKDGRQCLEWFRNRPEGYYDLILMDIQMPVMNGYEAARSIRSQGGAWGARVPIIALTAEAPADVGPSCRRAGMNGRLSKPIDLDAMAEALRKWIPG